MTKKSGKSMRLWDLTSGDSDTCNLRQRREELLEMLADHVAHVRELGRAGKETWPTYRAVFAISEELDKLP